MSELTDDQLDGLFRKSAEEFDPPFDPAAWQDMKARLDTNDHTMPVGTPIWKNLLRWGLPVILLLLLTGGGWYAYRRTKVPEKQSTARIIMPGYAASNPSEKQRLKPSTTALTPDKSTSSRATESPESPQNTVTPDNQPVGSTEAISERGKPVVTVDNVKAKLTAGNLPNANVATKSVPSTYRVKSGRERTARSRPGLSPVVPSANQSRTLVVSSSIKERKSGVSSLKRTKKTTDYETTAFLAAGNTVPNTPSFVKQRLKTKADTRSESMPNISASGSSTDGPVTSETATTEQAQPLTVSELAGRPARWAKPLIFTGRTVVAHPDTTRRSVVPASPVQRGLSVRFVVAPDLSTVGLKNFSRPGTNVGLLLEYRLAPRWSVQGGAIWSTKVYRALPSEYTQHSGDWGGYVMPASVDGRCNMIDIPLNIRYDFAVRQRRDGRLPSRWFVSGGMTSYIMNKEDYVYNYDRYAHNQNTSKDTITGGYGLSNLNLSIGYERALSRRLSWQVEPFMKVPLKGVGYFKIDLLSTGAFFSLRYKL